MNRPILLLAALACFCSATAGQQIQINKDNRTISVQAEDSVSVAPELAVVSVGYHNYAPDKGTAYEENLRVAGQINKALEKAGVPENNIETEDLTVSRTEWDEKVPPDVRKQREFEAKQTWKIRVPASQAQALVDLVIHAGANDLQDVDWEVADPVGLQAKASEAALAKARRIAEQLAAGLGTKLGPLVYASNQAGVLPLAGLRANSMSFVVARIGSSNDQARPSLKLYPSRVKQTATVYAVFAIE